MAFSDAGRVPQVQGSGWSSAQVNGGRGRGHHTVCAEGSRDRQGRHAESEGALGHPALGSLGPRLQGHQGTWEVRLPLKVLQKQMFKGPGAGEAWAEGDQLLFERPMSLDSPLRWFGFRAIFTT